MEWGEFVSIIGHSGCGKSTLLGVIAGLIKPSEGSVVLDGKEVLEPSPKKAKITRRASTPRKGGSLSTDNTMYMLAMPNRYRRVFLERDTWLMVLIYSITFGGFVGMSSYVSL